MNNKRLLDYDFETGVAMWHSYDPQTDTTYIEKTQDVEPILEANKSLQNWGIGGAARLNDFSRRGIKNNWWHVALIPNLIIEKWLLEEGINVFDRDHWPAVRRKLNSPDWRYLRTGTGRI